MSTSRDIINEITNKQNQQLAISSWKCNGTYGYDCRYANGSKYNNNTRNVIKNFNGKISFSF